MRKEIPPGCRESASGSDSWLTERRRRPQHGVEQGDDQGSTGNVHVGGRHRGTACPGRGRDEDLQRRPGLGSPLRSWREQQGQDGGAESVDSRVWAENFDRFGPQIVGRTMFTYGYDSWGDVQPLRRRS